MVQLVGQGGGKLSHGGHPRDVSKLVPLLLGVYLRHFPFSHIPVACPDALELTLLVGYRPAGMLDPAHVTVAGTDAELNLPRTGLLARFVVMCVPDGSVFGDDDLPEACRVLDKVSGSGSR